ncbi:RNA polymerase factor sigma-54 [Candidatus Thiosymbion oneisti]|uniref:RNA polymerase factor sigma-54 n=1 Tax=Candidatus Thiosymbion oneisti TaxID=589554 RepID=UPI000A983553|nr:RNA polymerase factor sigma-54 [Candidatus Thiosymbion oneisti]
MKQSLQFRLGQQLTMTPQLQQAIRLLQLSTSDLRQEIQEALDSNLMLENTEEVECLNGSGHLRSMDATLETAGVAADSEQEIQPESMPIPDELPVDVEWTDHYDSDLPSRGARAQATNEIDIFARHSKAPTLRDHLHWQLNLSRLDAASLAIATAIVDAINEDGYFTATPEELLATFDDADLTPEEIEIILHRVQSLDPPGVGARDLRECLLIQLRHLPEGTRMRGPAIEVCDRYFEALAKNDMEQIRRALRLSARAMDEITDLIRSLHPRPGTLIADLEPQYLVPDVIVRKRKTAWVVELNPETAPKLRVNPDYAKLVRRADRSQDNQCLKSHLQEARWFINSLASRNDTVLKVASKIVELQRDFLEYGEEAMKPMVLRDVAEALELHESTISRVTTNKYMGTPRGTFEFKYFFSSHLSTDSGGECSSTAVRACIRKLVAVEDPHHPLSDNKIATVLAEQGIRVARRTVAKYREGMGVPSSNERRRPG